METTVGIGLIGYGGIGKLHTLAYGDIPLYYPGVLPPFELKAVCTSKEETARKAAEEGGFPDWYTDIEKMCGRDDIQVVDINVPNFAHVEAVEIAATAGKHMYCEKPLARNLEEARRIKQAVENSGVLFGMTFNYRFSPAVLKARRMMEQGRLGEIYHFRANYLHTGYQNPDRPMSWRTDKGKSGGGALFDLGSHVIDLVRFLLGDVAQLRSYTRTFMKKRYVSKGESRTEPVDVDDAAWLQVELTSGAVGTIEVSRFATGTLDDLSIEIHGEKGALKYSLMDPLFLSWFDENDAKGEYGGERGWKKLQTLQNYPGAVIPPPRTIMGWSRLHAENQYQFLRAVAEKRQPDPGLEDGLKVQAVLETAYHAAREGGWQAIATW
jgi:predicted dehydrogenase